MFLTAGLSIQRPYLSFVFPDGTSAATSPLDRLGCGDVSCLERRCRGGESEWREARTGDSARLDLGGDGYSEYFGGRVVDLLDLCLRDGLWRRDERGSSSGISSVPTYS